MKVLYLSLIFNFAFMTFCDGWSDPVTIAYTTNAIEVDAAVNLSKTAINVWTENYKESSYLYSAIYSSGVITAPYLLSENGINGKVAIDQSGNGIVVWLERNQMNSDLMCCKFKPGVGWEEPKTIVSNTQIFSPQVAMNSSGNGCITWCNQTTGSVEGVMFAIGSDVYEPFEFLSVSGQNYNAQVKLDKSGAIYLCWENNISQGLSVTMFNNNIWSDPKVLSKGVINSVLNISEDGEGVLAWTNLTTYEIKAALLSNGFWGFPQIVSDVFSDCVSCAIYKGTAIVAWSDLNQGIVKARVFSNGGWSENLFELPLISNSDRPTTTVDSLGVAYVSVSNTEDYLKVIGIYPDKTVKNSKVFLNEGVVMEGGMKFSNLSSVFFWISNAYNMTGIKISTN